MAKATEEAMAELHGVLATVLKHELTREHKDANGWESGPPPAILNVVRQFLKDNGVEAYIDPAEQPAEGESDFFDMSKALAEYDKATSRGH